MQHRGASGILEQYGYTYDTAQMISGISRGSNTVAFGYDRTYQLVSERGAYQTNFMTFMSFMVSNSFAYDRAGNRVSLKEKGIAPKSYRHTADNQLTEIYWDSSKVTLGGEIQQAWTASWVTVKQSGTGSLPVTAAFVCLRGQPVAWEARDVPVTGSGAVSFEIIACTPDSKTVTQTVQYTKTSSGSGDIDYAYDANGNRTNKIEGSRYTEYQYDNDNQLIGISEWINGGLYFDYTYEYDVFGRRIAATEDGTTRHFVYDGLDVIAELDSTGAVTKTYVRGSGLGGGIGDIIAIQYPGSSIQDQYLSYNHRGDVVLVTTNNSQRIAGIEYDAFGKPATWNLSLGTRFTGFSSKEYDTRSGLSYYGFRFYDAQSGRWMNKDPLSWHAGVNLYRIAHNSPVGRIDHFGLWATKIHTEFGLLHRLKQLVVHYERGDTEGRQWIPPYGFKHLSDDLDAQIRAAEDAICSCDIELFELAMHYVQDYYGHASLGISWGTYLGDLGMDILTIVPRAIGGVIERTGEDSMLEFTMDDLINLPSMTCPRLVARWNYHDSKEIVQINDEKQITWPAVDKAMYVLADDKTTYFERQFTNKCSRISDREWRPK